MASLGSLSTNFFPNADELFSSTLSGTISGGAATVGISAGANGLSRYANGDIVTITIAPGDNTKQRTFTGVVNTGTNQITNCVWTEDPYSYGTGSYAAGTTVKDWRSATHTAQVTKGILQQHSLAGAHTNVTATTIVTSGNTTVGGILAVTGATNLTGAFDVANATATKRDQSGNTIAIDPMQRNEGFQGKDFIQTGLNPSSAAGLVVTIPAGTYYISGKRYTYGGGTKTLTASKDCYLDVDTSGTITSVEVANGATAGMTLTANSVRFAKIVTGGASVTSYNIGDTISSAFDPLGNRIRRLNPFEKLLGYAQTTSNFTTSSATSVQVTNVSSTVIIPSGNYPIRIRVFLPTVSNTSDNVTALSIYDGTVPSGTLLNESHLTLVTAGRDTFLMVEAIISPGAATKTYNAGLRTTAGTLTSTHSSTGPGFILVEIL